MVGEQIIRLRKERGISQEKLAELVGVSRQTVYKWESDIAQPNAENIRALYKAFGIEPNRLIVTDEFVLVEEDRVAEKLFRMEIEQRRIRLLYFLVVLSFFLFAAAMFSTVCLWFATGSPSTDVYRTSIYHVDRSIFVFMLFLSVALFAAGVLFSVLLKNDRRKAKRNEG